MKKCLEEHKPSKPPTEPGKEADARRPRPSGVSPRPPRPSREEFVSLVCFVTMYYLYSYNPSCCIVVVVVVKRTTFNTISLLDDQNN